MKKVQLIEINIKNNIVVEDNRPYIIQHEIDGSFISKSDLLNIYPEQSVDIKTKRYKIVDFYKYIEGKKETDTLAIDVDGAYGIEVLNAIIEQRTNELNNKNYDLRSKLENKSEKINKLESEIINYEMIIAQYNNYTFLQKIIIAIKELFK